MNKEAYEYINKVDREFIERAHKIAFGDEYYFYPVSNEEVLERLNEFAEVIQGKEENY